MLLSMVNVTVAGFYRSVWRCPPPGTCTSLALLRLISTIGVTPLTTPMNE
jgi:hypothetical protein